jgi:hypothetical protein
MRCWWSKATFLHEVLPNTPLERDKLYPLHFSHCSTIWIEELERTAEEGVADRTDYMAPYAQAEWRS